MIGYVGKKEVLDHGSVELIDSMGGDLSIVNGARQSFDQTSIRHRPDCEAVIDTGSPCDCDRTVATTYALARRDTGLINFLMREKHTSPFELVQAKFGVMCPLFVAREWMRHRTQSFNEMSARYTEMPEVFYVPDRDAVRVQKGKPGAYYYERVEDDELARNVQRRIHNASVSAFRDYRMMMEQGVAKELARSVLPVNTYTKFVVSANLLNWMRFLSLRNHEHAQHEIRVYAEAIEEQLVAVAPVAMEAFVKHGRLR